MKKQGFLKGSVILLGMVVITKIIGLMYKIPLTHILGGTGMGYFSAAYTVFTPIMAAIVSGIPSTMARITAENYALGRYTNLRKVKRTAVLIFGSIGLVASLSTMLMAKPLSVYVIKEPSAGYALLCIAPSVLFCTIMSVERGYFEGLKNMTPTAVSEIVETVFRLILGLGFAYAVRNYGYKQFELTGECFGTVCKNPEEVLSAMLPLIAAGAILGSSIASLIACVYIFIKGKISGDGITKQMLDSDKITDKSSHTSKLLITLALPVAFISVITTLTNMIDMLTINSCIKIAMKDNVSIFSDYIKEGRTSDMIPNFVYGSYTGFAVTIFGLVPTVTAMFGKSILPSMTESCAKNDIKSAGENLNKMMFISSIIAIPSGLIISVFSKRILEFLFYGRFDEIEISYQPLSILGIAVIFMSISLPCMTVIQTLGKPYKAVLIMIFSGIIKLILNIILIRIPEINISGAAISTAVSNLFVCIMSVREIYKLFKIKCNVCEIYIKPLYAGLLCVASAYVSAGFFSNQQFIFINHRIIFILSMIIGCIFYSFSLTLLCEMPKNAISELFRKKIQKKA